MLATLPEKTGRSVEEWIAALEASDVSSGTHTQQREWLMSQGLGRNHSGAVLWWRKNGAAIEAGGDSLVDDQYSGRRAPLRPIYEEVAATVRALGDDVEVLPRGTYVTFARGAPFAIAKPSSRAAGWRTRARSAPGRSRTSWRCATSPSSTTRPAAICARPTTRAAERPPPLPIA
jgi:hypothetical protein